MFQKCQNMNILTILHVHRRRVPDGFGDSRVPETGRRHLAKRGVLAKIYSAVVVIWMKLFSGWVSFCFLLRQVWGGPQPTSFAEPIDYLVGSCFINIQMKSSFKLSPCQSPSWFRSLVGSGIPHILLLIKQYRSTDGCSKLKRSVDMTSSGKNGLNIRTNSSPKWDRTRCPEE